MMDSLQDHKFNIRLVKTVKKYPVIYDCNIKGYKKIPCVLLRRKAWKSIGKELNCDPKTLHQKWHQFRKYFSHVMLLKQRGENAPYYLSEHLKFLIPYLKITHESVASDSSIEEVNQNEIDSAEEVEEMDQDIMHLDSHSNDGAISDEADVEVTEPHYNQNRRSEVVCNRSATLLPTHVAPSSTGIAELEQFSANGDPKLQFLLSLLPDLNVMTNAEMRQFKCKAQQLVDEILN
uniref:MADF domain-containing protein n=1 Tax=Ceratitis capitata TaxID=7213 RepID=W8BHI8_CERCA